MNCHEFQEVMSRSIDGELDSQVRREVALHLAGCTSCLNLINDDRFWDKAVIGLLDREAPSGLRDEILGGLTSKDSLSQLGWMNKLKLMAWGARRKNMTLMEWALELLIFVGLCAFVYYLNK